MRSVTSTEARKNWFKLLDDVAAGEVVEIRRGTHRIVLRCEPAPDGEAPPDYSALLKVDDSSSADNWGWEWSEDGLESVILEGRNESSS